MTRVTRRAVRAGPAVTTTHRRHRPTAPPPARRESPARPGWARRLTADTSGIADADGLTGASFSYQWLADDVPPYPGPREVPTHLAGADVGKAVKVRVSFTDDAGHAETLTSAATAAVAANPPAVTAVAITSDPGSDDTYALGDVITVSVNLRRGGGRDRLAAVVHRHGPGGVGRRSRRAYARAAAAPRR